MGEEFKCFGIFIPKGDILFEQALYIRQTNRIIKDIDGFLGMFEEKKGTDLVFLDEYSRSRGKMYLKGFSNSIDIECFARLKEKK